MVDITSMGSLLPSKANHTKTLTLEYFQGDCTRQGFCENGSILILKPLHGFRVNFFLVSIEWYIVKCHSWLTGKVAKIALPSSPHLPVDPQHFLDVPVLVVLFPPRRVGRCEVEGRENHLLVLPLLVGGRNGEGVHVGPPCIPEAVGS